MTGPLEAVQTGAGIWTIRLKATGELIAVLTRDSADEATARLLAASPRLAEALEAVMPLAESWADGMPETHPAWKDVLAARAAIRAVGR